MRIHIQGDFRTEEFSSLILEIGDGKLSEEEGIINIPGNLCDVVWDLNSLTERIYTNICQNGGDCASWMRERAILTPTNDSADSINNTHYWRSCKLSI